MGSTMGDMHIDVASVKSRLVDFRERERDIDNQIERLERMTAKMESAGAQPLSDMPRSPSISSDRMADYVAQKEELEQEIRSAIGSQSEEKAELEGVLSKIKSPDEKAVIRMRYFDRSSWNEVLDMLFGSRDDFSDKQETYLRRVHKIHGAALFHMSVILNENDPNTEVPADM